ncbi:MAG TPA: hypothetical protein VMW38_25000 [Terriglobia bacterium]|nr:hypothetical protein [Terriglobia bacterium]
MDEQLAVGKEIQSLWGAALSKQIERPRPWTREEVHAYLMAHYGINSMKLVKAKDVEELLNVFSGEAIASPAEQISDDDIPL